MIPLYLRMMRSAVASMIGKTDFDRTSLILDDLYIEELTVLTVIGDL